jgi:hypothetical protein
MTLYIKVVTSIRHSRHVFGIPDPAQEARYSGVIPRFCTGLKMMDSVLRCSCIKPQNRYYYQLAIGLYQNTWGSWGPQKVACAGYAGTVVRGFQDFDDADMSRLSRLVWLESLWIQATQVTDAGLAHLSGLTKLTALGLSLGLPGGENVVRISMPRGGG